MIKTYKIELIVKENGHLAEYDILVKAETKRKARCYARKYAKEKGYDLVAMASYLYKGE